VTARDFCFWLQGVFEVTDPKQLDEKQTDLVKRHLALVFKHEIDPAIDGGDPTKKAALDEVHGSKRPEPWQQPPHPGGVIMRC
jgi:hypothetical protein